MKKTSVNHSLLSLICLALILSLAVPFGTQGETYSKNQKLQHLGSYATGFSDKSGGVAEIIAYNAQEAKAYLVNGREKSLDLLSFSEKEQNLVLEKRIQLDKMLKDFDFGDLTSVAVHPEQDCIAVAVQAAAFDAPGVILLLDASGEYLSHYEAGVQPDMVCFSPDGRFVLSADEGEPREGLGQDQLDPLGSVTVVDLKAEKPQSQIVNFQTWDKQREDLLAANILLKKEALPSKDFEPEYIAVDDTSTFAYVVLQEANAVARLNLEDLCFEWIYSLGYKDHSKSGNEIDILRDKEIKIEGQDLFGVRMPDGIAYYQIAGQEYLFTANEGDASEWGEGDEEYSNMRVAKIQGQEVELLDNGKMGGLPDNNSDYIIGARSFSIFRIGENGLTLVFDSGSDFERITAEAFPAYFNASNKNNKLDGRSDAKGPEPEDIKVAALGEKIFAYIGLERIGGLMVYDVTNPVQAQFEGYINSRNFDIDFLEDAVDSKQGDISPEGIAVISRQDSPTGQQLILVAHEVSGTVALYEQFLEEKAKETETKATEAEETNATESESKETKAKEAEEKDDGAIARDTVEESKARAEESKAKSEESRTNAK